MRRKAGGSGCAIGATSSQEMDVGRRPACRAGAIQPRGAAALPERPRPDPAKRGRNAEFFIFSRHFVGSDSTGYVASELMARRNRNSTWRPPSRSPARRFRRAWGGSASAGSARRWRCSTFASASGCATRNSSATLPSRPIGKSRRPRRRINPPIRAGKTYCGSICSPRPLAGCARTVRASTSPTAAISTISASTNC